jgi:ribosomal protein S18 acetylase RimI-like enzyme
MPDFNEEVRKLYKHLGYKLVGIIPGFYKKGVDEYLW